MMGDDHSLTIKGCVQFLFKPVHAYEMPFNRIFHRKGAISILDHMKIIQTPGNILDIDRILPIHIGPQRTPQKPDLGGLIGRIVQEMQIWQIQVLIKRDDGLDIMIVKFMIAQYIHHWTQFELFF